MPVAPPDVIEPLAGYLELTEEDAELLRAVQRRVAPAFDAIVTRFYERIEARQEARAVLERSGVGRDALRCTLRDWLRGVFGGCYDEAWLERRLRIGRAHLRIGLPQRYMFSAMNRVREDLHRALASSFEADPDPRRWPPARRRAAHAAIDRILDLELAVMLESYRNDYVERIRQKERLANLGQFAAMIGHELRNPMAVMQTSLYLLRRRLAEDPERAQETERHLGRLEEQLALCRTIVGDLLEMARNRPPRMRSVDVAALVEEAARAVPAPAHVRLRVDVHAAPVRARLDPDKLRHLVSNLVLNAVQSAATGGARGLVHVVVRAEGAELLLEVADDGPGLPEGLRDRLFEPLATGRPQGLGLGLALCQQVVQGHGGHIEARDRPGGGACFVARFPGAAQPAEKDGGDS